HSLGSFFLRSVPFILRLRWFTPDLSKLSTRLLFFFGFLPSPFVLHASEEVRHLDRRQRRFPSLVPSPGRRALHGLLQRVAGDNAVSDGHCGLDGDSGE